MDEGKKSVILYTEWAQPLKTLSLEDKGRIFDAILSYSETGETPHFDSNAAEMPFPSSVCGLTKTPKNGPMYAKNVAKQDGLEASSARQTKQIKQMLLLPSKTSKAKQIKLLM